MKGDHWFEDQANLRALGRFLTNKKQYTGTQLQHFYERPWAYDKQWIEMLHAQALGTYLPEHNDYPF